MVHQRFADNPRHEMESKYDKTFMAILQEEKNITSFLDSFFGFLYRCTDFYVESTPDQRLGFPPGVAKKLVLDTLRKWHKVKSLSETSASGLTKASPTVQEVTVDTTDKNVDVPAVHANVDTRNEDSIQEARRSAADCYNGAAYDGYRWSQSIVELDVVVAVPPGMRDAKQLRVEIRPGDIEVALRGADGAEDVVLLKGRLLFKVKSSESYWCLEPGKHVNMHLEKCGERWWESLLEDEPRIQLSRIDCSRRMDDMAEIEQMKVEELMWNQRRKLLGQPTSDQIRQQQMLQRSLERR